MPCPPIGNKNNVYADTACRVPTSKQKNIKTIMKKTYIAPEVEEIKVNVVNMLAASMGISEEEVNTSEEGVQENRREGLSSKSVWESEW